MMVMMMMMMMMMMMGGSGVVVGRAEGSVGRAQEDCGGKRVEMATGLEKCGTSTTTPSLSANDADNEYSHVLFPLSAVEFAQLQAVPLNRSPFHLFRPKKFFLVPPMPAKRHRQGAGTAGDQCRSSGCLSDSDIAAQRPFSGLPW
ncbi:hypothetical protein IWX46DRAFT_610507 [Phyllosticta citricarpa]|uniref:Secreted protein n=1 Tax=Phyllosticta citricarpa TaxID=55181 RepID=A0ABR1LN29_9PEZI